MEWILSPDTSLRTTARKSPGGEIIFIDNPSSLSKKITLNIADKDFTPGGDKSIMVDPGEIFCPVIHDLQ